MAGESKRYKMLPDKLGKIDKMMFYRNLGNKTNRNEVRNINWDKPDIVIEKIQELVNEQSKNVH